MEKGLEGGSKLLGFTIRLQMLRHALRLKLANDGFDTQLIQNDLGHKSISQRCATPSSLLRNQKHVEVIAAKHRRPVMRQTCEAPFRRLCGTIFSRAIIGWSATIALSSQETCR